MAEQYSQPRALLPRWLEQQESLNPFNQWIVTFKNFYLRCTFYGYFLQPGLTWTTEDDRGLGTETTGLKRTPQVLASDLDGFLHCISGYIPFDYVSDKLISEATNSLPVLVFLLF